jgi:BirA family transcriptional regulator, biotin operon repressor / biotin---[acetyl-CoA-carboxylase] ligase
MPSVSVPEWLDRLANSGAAGLPVELESDHHRELLQLLKWGYPVQLGRSVARFVDDGDALVPALIRSEAGCRRLNLAVHPFLELSSTNDLATELARAAAPEGSLIVAETQTAGRGRKGRNWFTSPGASLCFSLVLRPHRPVEEWPLLGLVSGTALARSLVRVRQELAGAEGPLPELKWPNDVLLAGRKVAGILLEATADDSGNRAAVIGIGVNVRASSMPPGLSDGASTLETVWKCNVSRRCVLVRFLKEFESQYESFLLGERSVVLEAWKAHSPMCSDTPVWVAEEGERWSGVSAGLDDRGALRVKTTSGTERIVLAADVSIRHA